MTLANLSIDYFDEPSATALSLDYARIVGGSEKVQRYEVPIRQVIRAFFDAIDSAIGASGRLWQELRGRAFAGYAPVLAALGALIGAEDDYQKLQQRLRVAGPRNAWDVLEEVASRILVREADKVQDPLRKGWSSAVPPQAYDDFDQLDLLTSFLTAQPLRPSPRLTFGSAGALAAYREAVTQHLQDHPFLRGETPVNDVLGSLVLAHSIARGTDLSRGQGPTLLAAYGRQPFLWRFFRSRLQAGPVISGDHLSYILTSLWSDEKLTSGKATVEVVGVATKPCSLRLAANGESLSVEVLPPLVFQGELRDLTVNVPGDEVVFSSSAGPETRSLRCVGNVSVRASTIRFEVDRLQVGELGTPSTSHLVADQVISDQRVRIELDEKSTLIVGGAFQGRHPWDGIATLAPGPPSADKILNLLSDCEQRLPGALTVVVYANYELTDDYRVDWARRYGDLFPRLLRGLVTQGLATTAGFQSSDVRKMRVRPNLHWSDLKGAYKAPGETDSKLREVFKALS